MPITRRRNNRNKKTRSIRRMQRGGDASAEKINDVNSLLSQYFGKQLLEINLIKKYMNNLQLTEFEIIYKKYLDSSNLRNNIDNLISQDKLPAAGIEYGNVRSNQQDVVLLGTGQTAVGVAGAMAAMAGMVTIQSNTISNLSETIGKDGLAIPPTELSEGQIDKMQQDGLVANLLGTGSSALRGTTSAPLSSLSYASTALGLGTVGVAAISATGLGLVILFALISTTVYISNLYLKEKELQELSRLLVGVFNYIKNDAHVIYMFYKQTGKELPKTAKLVTLLEQLYKLLFKTLSYFPEKVFRDAYIHVLNCESVHKRLNELDTLYKTVYNTKEKYSKCKDIEHLLETGNFLMYRYIFTRMCIIEKDLYANEPKAPTSIGGDGTTIDNHVIVRDSSYRNGLFGTMRNAATSVVNAHRKGVSDFKTYIGNKIEESNKTGVLSKIKESAETGKLSKALYVPRLIASTTSSGAEAVYFGYRRYFRPIGSLQESYNKSISQPIAGKFCQEPQIKNLGSSNTAFLGSGEQFRQLLGDYAIMDTTYTMSVTKYIFDFNTYAIENANDVSKLKLAIPSNIPEINLLDGFSRIDLTKISDDDKNIIQTTKKETLNLRGRIVYEYIFNESRITPPDTKAPDTKDNANDQSSASPTSTASLTIGSDNGSDNGSEIGSDKNVVLEINSKNSSPNSSPIYDQ